MRKGGYWGWPWAVVGRLVSGLVVMRAFWV